MGRSRSKLAQGATAYMCGFPRRPTPIQALTHHALMMYASVLAITTASATAGLIDPEGPTMDATFIAGVVKSSR